MRSSPSDWIKEDIYLSPNEAADQEALRFYMGGVSDSESLRQVLKYFEQLVDDTEQNKPFTIHRQNGTINTVAPDLFRGPSLPPEAMIRRSLILHKSSKHRINALQERIEVKDMSAVIRAALRFAVHIVRETEAGSRFFTVDEKGYLQEVRFGALAKRQESERTNSDISSAEPIVPTQKNSILSRIFGR